MDVAEWTLLVTAVGTPTAIVTLALVIRGELRERRRWPTVMWTFRDLGTRTKEGRTDTVAELVQFGGTPVRLMQYWMVGFRIRPEEGAYMRSDVRGEDSIRLFLDMQDRDNAWILLAYFSRDDNRWLHYRWVGLEPLRGQLRQQLEEQLDHWEQHEQRSLRLRARRLWLRVAQRPIIEPVGPSGADAARIKVQGNFKEKDLTSILSLARAADESGAVVQVG